MNHATPAPPRERHRHRSATLALLAAAILFVGACAGAAATRVPNLPSGPATSGPEASGLARPSPTASVNASPPPREHPDLAALAGALATREIATGLASPLWVTGARDGSGRLFVVEQGGRVLVMEYGAIAPAPYLDIHDRVRANGEQGLLGLAFAPGFGSGGEDRLYVHYSDRDGATTLSEFRAPTGVASVDPSTERILLREPQPYENHNGGWIGFDPGGMLLLGLGDGGSGGDPENRASNTATILGKMLRLDVLGGPADGREYRIPADNPYAAVPGARPEILHIGLRNPFRASVDAATGTLWIGDVGQGDWEEIDAAAEDARGLDFGWRRWEGRHCFDPPTGCDPAGVTRPLAEYSHADGCSVIGGVVYRGDAIPALRGAYLFSDYCSGTLWALDAGLEAGADAAQSPVTLLATGRRISAIGTDDAGEVWLTDLGGALLQLLPGG